MPELTHQELTGDIIGAYYEVYNRTPRTHPEYIYERAMMEELRLRGRASGGKRRGGLAHPSRRRALGASSQKTQEGSWLPRQKRKTFAHSTKNGRSGRQTMETIRGRSLR